MGNLMKYTFLLPAYKAKYLNKAIESILNQSYRDFCLIISDDCSPEDLKSIVDSFNDERIVYRRNEVNVGGKNLVEHWNLLLELVDTEYLILASDDDMYETSFLSEVNMMISCYPKVDLIHARVQMIDSDGCIIKRDAMYEEYVSQLDFLTQLGFVNHIECIANYVFRTSALKAMGGFVSFPLAWTSDTATVNLMSKNGVANTTSVLFNFRMSGINISSQETLPTIARMKCLAICSFVEQMKTLFKGLQKQETPLKENTYKLAYKIQIDDAIRIAGYYSCALSWKEFISFVHKYPFSKFEVYTLLKKWIVYKFKNYKEKT